MSADLTQVTEIATALGTLKSELAGAMSATDVAVRNVPEDVWTRLRTLFEAGEHADSFATAFANGRALLQADDGLRGRVPVIVEWKGPHRLPGDDVVPADVRIDHVFLVSCKYLSKLLLNPGPQRLFDRLLVGERRSTKNWFHETAPVPFQDFYDLARHEAGVQGVPERVDDLRPPEQRALRDSFRSRVLPPSMQPAWAELCREVSQRSAERWRRSIGSRTAATRLLWRLLRITASTYFVLGTDKIAHVRLRVASTWDWNDAFELQVFDVHPRAAGQPEVGWRASVRDRASGLISEITGHVEIRWSHGRFNGSPESKVYLDTPHAAVPGYYALS